MGRQILAQYKAKLCDWIWDQIVLNSNEHPAMRSIPEDTAYSYFSLPSSHRLWTAWGQGLCIIPLYLQWIRLFLEPSVCPVRVSGMSKTLSNWYDIRLIVRMNTDTWPYSSRWFLFSFWIMWRFRRDRAIEWRMWRWVWSSDYSKILIF